MLKNRIIPCLDVKNGDKLGFSERARAVNKGLLPSKVKKKKNVKK